MPAPSSRIRHRISAVIAALTLVFTIASTAGASAAVPDHEEIVPGVAHSPDDSSIQRRAAPEVGINAAVAPPANDAFANATKITSVPFSTTNAPYGGATLEAGEPTACRTTDPDITSYFSDAENSIWYSFTSPVRQTLTFSGSVNGRESVVNAYPAGQLSELQRVSCVETEFRTANHLQAEAGKTYYFQVGDLGNGTPIPVDSTARLDLAASAPIANTTFASAATVSVPSTVNASLSKVDYNWYSPYIGCPEHTYALMGSLWYKFTAATTGRVKIDVGDSYYDADFAVYDSDGTTPGTPIACPPQANAAGPDGPGVYDKALANATFDTVAGKTYFVQVGGFDFSAGDAVIKFTNVPLPLMTLMPTPTITGSTVVGNTLTANPGTWDAGTTLTYQWKRNGGNYIPGATSPTYVLTSNDLGATLTVSVTGTKPGYSGATKTSATTARVTAGTLTSGTPTISGTVAVGQTVTAAPGTWGPQPVTYGYQWRRGGTAIPGATGSNYTLVAADAGTSLTVSVTGAKAGYTSVTKVSAAKTVAKGTLSGATPKITGTTRVGSTLTAAPGTWSPAPVVLSYQWYRSGVAIPGATKSTYKLVASDKGKRITVKVTGTKTGYNSLTTTSASTAVIG